MTEDADVNHAPPENPETAALMADAASRFLAGLTDAQRDQVRFDFADEGKRRDWSFLPVPERDGPPIGALGDEVADHIGALRREGELLATAAEHAGMDAAVPYCPDWTVRDLLKHTGYVHRWATAIVARGLTRPEGRASEPEILSQGPDDAGLPGWFREGHAALVQALETAAPGLDCWAFLSAPSPLAFWARRQAHETAMHRADAEQAAAGPAGAVPGPAGAVAGPVFEPAFDPAFAADGVDELIMGFLARNIRRGSWPGLDGSLAIHAADGPAGAADWLVIGGAAAGVARGGGPADCDVTGPAADLYLTLWNRRPVDGLRVTGDSGVLGAFTRTLRITW